MLTSTHSLMASLTTTSLQFLSLPFSSSKTLISQSISPISSHLFSFPLIPTSINLFKPTPSSRIIPNVTVSPNLQLDKETELNYSPESKLSVGNLPFHIDNSTLARLFEQSGTVETVEVVYDILNGRSKGFAFVKMSSLKEAETAAKMFDGYELDGEQLRVNYGTPPRKKSFIKEPRNVEKRDNNTNNNTVYVGNLSWSVDNETLETLFWEHGNVLQAKVFYDKDSGRSRGFGFVTYSCANEVYSAVESLDGVDLGGRNIRVSVAVPPQRHRL